MKISVSDVLSSSAKCGVIACAVVLLTACGPSDIVRAGPGTYMVSDSGGIYTQDPSGIREAVYKKANKFCDDKGETMTPVKKKERPYSLGHHTAAIELTFKCQK